MQCGGYNHGQCKESHYLSSAVAIPAVIDELKHITNSAETGSNNVHFSFTSPQNDEEDINILLLSKDVDNAKIVLEQYESLVLEHLSDTSLDYGICKLSKGIIDMMEGTPESAEVNLLAAESIIGNAVGTDNDYMRTTYRYLNNLYARWRKPEKAIEYRDKYFNTNRITTNKNA